MIERRDTHPSEIRVDGENPGRFEADVLVYGVVDDYNTIFDRGVFDAGLAQKLPKITWGHDWTDPIGRWVDWKNTEQRTDEDHGALRLIGELDDFDAVPRAKQAWAQLRSGTMDEFSVGFHRIPDGVYRDDDNREHFREASLDEAAVVLKGAVPGTKLVGIRSKRNGTESLVPIDFVVLLAEQVISGTLSKEAAAIAVDLAAGVPSVGEAPPAVVDDPVVVPAGSPADPDTAAADLILEELGLT